MGILLLIVVGAAAGFIATRMMKLDWGVLQTIAVGVLGSFVGLAIMRFLTAAFGMLSGFVGAVLGALLLIWVWQKVAPKK